MSTRETRSDGGFLNRDSDASNKFPKEMKDLDGLTLYSSIASPTYDFKRFDSNHGFTTPVAENSYHHQFQTSSDIWGPSSIPSRRPDLNNLILGIPKKDEADRDENQILSKPSLTDLEPALKNPSPIQRKTPPGLAPDSEIFSNNFPASPTSHVSERLKSLLDEAESPVPRRLPDWDMASPTSPCGSPQVFGTHPDSHYWQSYYQAAVSNFEQARQNLNAAEQAMRMAQNDNNWNGYDSYSQGGYYNPYSASLERGSLRQSSPSGPNVDRLTHQSGFRSVPSFSELPVQYVNDNSYGKEALTGIDASVPQKLCMVVREEDGTKPFPELEEWSPKIKPPEGLVPPCTVPTPPGSVRSSTETKQKKGRNKVDSINRSSQPSTSRLSTDKVDISLSDLVPQSHPNPHSPKTISSPSKNTKKNETKQQPKIIKEPTTMMLRNIPNKYTRDMLLDEIRAEGFINQYDFVYLPIDFRHRCNVGYAFVNMVNPEVAAEFKKVFDGYKLTAVKSSKVCGVSEAKVQGQQENADQYRNSAVTGMAEKFHPLFFKDGNRIPFPPPLDENGNPIIVPVKERKKKDKKKDKENVGENNDDKKEKGQNGNKPLNRARGSNSNRNKKENDANKKNSV